MGENVSINKLFRDSKKNGYNGSFKEFVQDYNEKNSLQIDSVFDTPLVNAETPEDYYNASGSQQEYINDCGCEKKEESDVVFKSANAIDSTGSANNNNTTLGLNNYVLYGAGGLIVISALFVVYRKYIKK